MGSGDSIKIDRQMSQDVTNHVESLRRVHDDNSSAKHFAEDPFGTQRSTMFLTAFVYEYFIYNSLYQVDWPKSTDSGDLKYYDRGGEERKQTAFEGFLKSESTPDLVRRAFMDLGTHSMEDSWTKIKPDPGISSEEGEKFFHDFRQFQKTLHRLEPPKDPVKIKKDFEGAFMRIGELRPFIYAVRCNIFHGRKSLAEAVDKNQNKRIEVYFLFLKGLVTSFFEVFERLRACRDQHGNLSGSGEDHDVPG